MILISQVIMSIAYIIFLMAVLPNFSTLLKNKNNLKGFNKYGTLATASGLVLVQLSFLIDKVYIPVLIGMPNMCYWIAVTYYMWRGK